MRVSPVRRETGHCRIPSRVAPLILPLLFGIAVPACSTMGVEAQAVPANVPGTLLRRLGDAADAFRTGSPVWIVADPNPPHEISGVYDTMAEADDDPRLSTGFVRYGPFITPVDTGFDRQVFAVCTHTRRPYSQWMCPPIRPIIPLDSIRSIDLVVNAPGREPVRLTLSPDSVDLIFFTLSAFDRYLAAYYASAFGAEYAAMLRDSLAAMIGRRDD